MRSPNSWPESSSPGGIRASPRTLSLKKLVHLDGQQAVLYRSRMNSFVDRNFEAMDPLEWLAHLADHIPDPGKHRTHPYGFYASRVRASRTEKEGSELRAEAAPTKRRCPPSWARLISTEDESVARPLDRGRHRHVIRRVRAARTGLERSLEDLVSAQKYVVDVRPVRKRPMFVRFVEPLSVRKRVERTRPA